MPWYISRNNTKSDALRSREEMRNHMEKGFFAFGTMNFIQTEQGNEQLLQEMAYYCSLLDNRLSVFKPGSEISQINRCAGQHTVTVSEETFRILQCAAEYAAVSGGAFDPTIRPAVALWNIGHEREQVPEQEALDQIKPLVDYRCLHLDPEQHTVFLEKAGQAIDLGGIAKGYAADCIAGKLRKNGIDSALLNFGGTIWCIGNKPDGTSWRVGIQNPIEKRGSTVGSIRVNDGAVVTSGVNERFFYRDGKRYHHLLDPRTLQPAQSGVLGVTAAGGNAMQLDAATTAFFVLGPEKGIALAKKIKTDVLYLMEDGNIYATEGFTGGQYAFQMKNERMRV